MNVDKEALYIGYWTMFGVRRSSEDYGIHGFVMLKLYTTRTSAVYYTDA